LELFDYLRYLAELQRNRTANQLFVEKRPDFRLPPPDLAYDAYGHTNWDTYYRTGRETAQYFSDLIKAHIAASKKITLCEWGCGAARVLRHMASFFPEGTLKLYGFDYNKRTIQWCSANLPDIIFKHNLLSPPLPEATDTFDGLYCLSVLTHLSYEMQTQWIKELSRVVKPQGLIILTTHGNAARAHLLADELQAYDAGKLVVRGLVREGKRNYVAYHPPVFVREELLRDYTVRAHITRPPLSGFTQDIWVFENSNELSAQEQM
jgi:SAM-dependent methyltransferase